MRTTSATTRLAFVGVGLIVLLGVVAIASRGHATPAAGGTHDRGASQTLFNVVFTVWLVAMAGMAGLLVYLHTLQRRERAVTFWNPRRVIVGLVALTLSATLLVIGMRFLHNKPVKLHKPKVPPAATPSGKGKKSKDKTPQTAAQPSFEWQLAAGIVALILGATLTAILRARHRRNEAFEQFSLEQELRLVLDEALDDLMNETDPRKAVIAAYARMERALAAHGLPRRPSEAPLEYLSRVLLELQVTEPAVRSLTNLFQRAKFSLHDVDTGMKDQAIEALLSLRDDLRAIDKSADAPTLLLRDVPGHV
ncbi:MAG TPA: DUF4129 domain-containing protein [Gaiellaceae bacterium]